MQPLHVYTQAIVVHYLMDYCCVHTYIAARHVHLEFIHEKATCGVSPAEARRQRWRTFNFLVLLVLLVSMARPKGVKDSAPRKSRQAADAASRLQAAASSAGAAGIAACLHRGAASSSTSSAEPAAAAPEPLFSTSGSGSFAQGPAPAGPSPYQQQPAETTRNEHDPESELDDDATAPRQEPDGGAEGGGDDRAGCPHFQT